MDKDDAYIWIKKVILSCETVRQDITADKLIANFYTMYKDRDLYVKLQFISIDNSNNLTVKPNIKTS